MKNAGKNVLAVLIAIALVLTVLGLSWGVTVFIYWLITLCFELEWSLLHATGVWLIMLLLSMVFGGSSIKVKNSQ